MMLKYQQVTYFHQTFIKLRKDKFRTFGASQALGASEPYPRRPQVYMTLTYMTIDTQLLNPQGPIIAWTY